MIFRSVVGRQGQKYFFGITYNITSELLDSGYY